MFLFDRFKPKVLFEKESSFNGHVKVLKFYSGIVNLYADGIIQSTSYHNRIPSGYWKKVLDIIKSKTKPEDIKTVLVLGLGGGTIQGILAKNLSLDRIDSVEIDPVMIEAAETFFDLSTVKNHKVFEGEVVMALKDPVGAGLLEKYDLVISDVFIGSAFNNRFDANQDLTKYAKLIKDRCNKFVLFNSVFLKSDKEGIKKSDIALKSVFSNLKHTPFTYPVMSDNHLFYSSI